MEHYNNKNLYCDSHLDWFVCLHTYTASCHVRCQQTPSITVFVLDYYTHLGKAIISLLLASHLHVQQEWRRAGGDYLLFDMPMCQGKVYLYKVKDFFKIHLTIIVMDTSTKYCQCTSLLIK